MGQIEARNLGMPSLPLVEIPHPMQDLSPGQVRDVAEKAVDTIIQVLCGNRDKLSAEFSDMEIRQTTRFQYKQVFETEEEREAIQLKESVETINSVFYRRGWTDGLPIMPPTEKAVEEMLKGADPDSTIAVLPPKMGRATLKKIAINTVMAGCEPAALPVVLAAVRAVSEPEFQLMSIQCTTHNTSVLLIINGPVVHELNINSGYNVFGPGWRSNATIGRAIRMILMNIGGAIPGTTDRSTFGHPGKYTYCIAENEAYNPWEPLHVHRGFRPDESTVTVVGAEAPWEIHHRGIAAASAILTTAAETMKAMGTNNALFSMGEPIFMLCPEHAGVISREGWSRQDVQEFIFNNARNPLYKLQIREPGMPRADWPNWLRAADPLTMIPIAEKAEDIMVIVAGGGGKHSAFIPTFGYTKAVTKAIDTKLQSIE